MKLSFFTMPIHPLDKPVTQSLAEDREAFILADELGYAETYCGEHTTDKAEIITSCVAFLASLAYETKNIRLGTGTVNMPNSHPARIAAEVAMLDHMLEGRLNFGISPGGLMSDAEGRIRQSAKDFTLIQEGAAAAGQGLPFTETYLAMMRDAMEHGEGDLDNSAILLPISRTKPA